MKRERRILCILVMTLLLIPILGAFAPKPAFALETRRASAVPDLQEGESYEAEQHDKSNPKSSGDSPATSPEAQRTSDLRDINQWKNLLYQDGNTTRLIIGAESSRFTLPKLEEIASAHEATVTNIITIKDEISAVTVEVPLSSLSLFVAEVESLDLARYIEPPMKVQAQTIPNDPYWSSQWGPQRIEADWAWNTTVGDNSMLVAVVDTGVYYPHEDLAANYVPLGYDWVNNDADPLDDNGHGTHVAGTIAAVTNNGIGIAGMAQVYVMAEKVLDAWGGGYDEGVASGIIHAVDQGARIISMSLGGYGDSQLLHDAVRYAYDSGVLIIAAAGNDNTNTKLYPAGYDEVIAVAATDQYDNKAYFSNWGDWIELAAPGVDIYSTVPWGYTASSGTSMATPHVSGVAALIWSQYPQKARDWIRLWLRQATDDLGDPGFDVYYGYGRTNARKAVEQTPPTHELMAYRWAVPPYVEPGAIGIINASVLNFGESNETDVAVQLLVNDISVDSTLIDFLASGNLATISLTWTPTVEGPHNVTFHVVPVPGETNMENNALSTRVYVGTPVKAVVLHSAGSVVSEIIINWQVLNNEWATFGNTMIYVDYATLNKADITYDDIAATNADVLIISCASDPSAGWEFTPTEANAIARYTYEGHGLIATAGTFYYMVPANNLLAPLFGLNEAIAWQATGTDLLHLAKPTHPLFANVPNPIVFPDTGTVLPSDGRWDSNELVGGQYLALGHFQESAIVEHRGLLFIAPLLEYIPARYRHHLQLLYNAITWSRYQKPEHELIVSLEAPTRLQPGESTLLNATVSNAGRSNETAVELQLIIEGAVINSVTIPELAVDSSYALTYSWTPTVHGAYNITAYAPPLIGEDFEGNNIAKQLVMVLSITVRDVLVYADDYYVAPSSRYVILALNNLGINYTYYSDDPWGFGTALVSQSWDMVVIDHCNYYALGNYWTELEAYVRNGGSLVISAFDIDGSNSEETTLWDTLGVRWVSDMSSPEPVYRWVPTHPVFTFPNTVNDFTDYVDGYVDHGDHVAATAGASIAGFTTLPTEDHATIIVGNTYPTILISCKLAEFRYDQDRDGKLDAIELWENAIVNLACGYEHDLAASLNAPRMLELGDPVLLNATVRNRGSSTETDIELYLLVNGTVIASATVPELLAGESYTLHCPWAPTRTGSYNITAYTLPVPDEEHTINNVATARLNVFFYVRRYCLHEWVGAGARMGWHADDASWEYTLPFVFPFYGVDYTTIYISSNGLISFTSHDSSLGNSIPNLAAKQALAVAWDDWTTYDPGDVYIWQNYTHVGIRWDVRHYGSGVTAYFEALLRVDGVIQLNYDYSDGPVSATIGLSNGAGHILAEDVTSLSYLNTIIFTPLQPDHDIAVTLDAPAYLEPVTAVLLNTTVYNLGSSNETDVELQLLINGTIVDSVLIPELPSGASNVLRYVWTPTAESTYNITAYALPVPDEEYTENNVAAASVRVRYIIARVAVLNSVDVPPYFVGGWDNNYQELVDALNAQGFDAQAVTNAQIMEGVLGSFEVFVMVDNAPSDAAVPHVVGFWSNGGGVVAFDSSICFLCYAGILPPESTGTNGIYVYWDYDTSSQTRISAAHPVTAGYEVGQVLYGPGGNAEYRVEALAGTTAHPYYTMLAEDLTRPDRAYVSAYEPLSAGKVVHIWDYSHWNNTGLRLMILNAMEWTATPHYAHDIRVSLAVPASLELGYSTILNATARNIGLNNETSIELYLLINGTVADSVVIPELSVGEFYTINYLWTPARAGSYNITAYTLPVPDEEHAEDNTATQRLDVPIHFYARRYCLHEWVGAGVPMGWHADDASWEYTLPFVFPFYGVDYTTIYISSNGLISFTSPDSSWGSSISDLAARLALAVAWDDWTTYDPGDVYIWQNSTHVGIQWYARHYGSGVTAYFEALLRVDGVIQLNYDYSDGPVSATIGLSNGAGDILAEDVTSLSYLNTIIFTPLQPDHDIAVTLATPSTSAQVGSPVLLNVTVANEGSSNETNLECRLMIGDVVEHVELVPELATGCLHAFTHEWTPTMTGMYNVTVYAAPVVNETLTSNNIVTTLITVEQTEVRDVAILDVFSNATQAYVGRTVTITVIVANEGTTTEAFEITVFVNETVIDVQTPSFGPGENATLLFYWNTAGFTASSYYTVRAEASPLPSETDLADNIRYDGTVKILTVGDLNGDDVINIFDIVMAAAAYRSTPEDPNWNPNADVAPHFGIVDIFDLVTIASRFRQTP